MCELSPAVTEWLGADPVAKSTLDQEHSVDPSATIERASAHAIRLGITRLADITGLDTIGIPVATAYRPNARSLSVSQGKGLTPDAARASALMEAVETAHAERPPVTLRWERIDELDVRYVDPSHLPHRNDVVLDRDRPLLWATGVSLTDGSDVMVPFDAVHLDQTLMSDQYLHVTSNGLASGNNRGEAVVHALCELVERDATRLWELAGPVAQSKSRIDPSTVTDEHCRGLIARFEAAGVDVALFDVTSDVGVPVVLAQVADRSPDFFRPIAPAAGIGCHLHPVVAVRRALTEAAQTRLIDIAGARDDLDHARYERAVDGEAFRVAPVPPDALAFSRQEGSATDTMTGDAAVVIGALCALGFEGVAIDLTRLDIDIPVVRVVVAGLEGLPTMMTGHEQRPGPRGRRVAA